MPNSDTLCNKICKEEFEGTNIIKCENACSKKSSIVCKANCIQKVGFSPENSQKCNNACNSK